MEKIPGPFKASAASAQVDNSVKEKKLFIKRRGNLPKQSVKILCNWLIAHQQDAYPCEKEKIRLAQETELTLEQVSNWFINARRRILPELLKRNGQNPEDYRITRKKIKSAKLCIDKTDSDSVDNTAKNNDEDLYLLSCLTSCNKNNSYSSEMHPISPNASKYLNRWSGFKTDSENNTDNTDTEAGSDIGNLDCEELLKKISYDEVRFVSQDEKNNLLLLASVANTRKKICVCVS